MRDKAANPTCMTGLIKLDHRIAPNLFDFFIREKVSLKYAERFLDAEQIVEVDVMKIPGFSQQGDAKRHITPLLCPLLCRAVG
jgi:hypothetical protein